MSRQKQNIFVFLILVFFVFISVLQIAYCLNVDRNADYNCSFGQKLNSTQKCLSSCASCKENKLDFNNRLIANRLRASNVAVSDDKITANFNCDDTNLSIKSNLIAESEAVINNKMSNKSIKNIEKYAETQFGNSYTVAGLVHFSVYKNSIRMQDFSKLESIELRLQYNFKKDDVNLNELYRAVFVKLNIEDEERAKNNLSFFDNIGTEKLVAKTVKCEAEGEQINLNIDADSDGFVFLLVEGNRRSSIGLIIIIIGSMVSVILSIAIVAIFQNYKREKLKMKTSSSYDANKVKTNVSLKTESVEAKTEGVIESGKTKPVKPTAVPKTLAKGPLPIPKKPTLPPRPPRPSNDKK